MSMNLPLKAAFFLLANLIGSFTGTAFFYAIMLSGMTERLTVGIDPLIFQRWFITGSFATWALCACFSFAWFYYENNWRWFFLLAPIAAPFLFGLGLVF
jgi:hypothetical protein